MQWIRFIKSDQGDRLVVDELLADVLCNLSCVSDITAHIATSRALNKTSWSLGMYHSATAVFFLCAHDIRTIQQQCGANHILSVNFCVRDVRIILQQCGANHILSVYFCVCDIHTILQQCGANRIFSVNFCVRDVLTIQQQCGANCILSVYFCEQDVCTHSATVWGKPFLFSKFS